LQKILVVRLSSMGDIVLTTPLLKALKRRFPQAKIAFLTKRQYRDLLLHNPDLDEIFTWEDDLSSLRRERFDLFLDLQANLKSLLLLPLRLKASRRIRYKKRHLSRWALTRFKWIPFHPIHTVDLYLRALAPLGVNHSPQPLPRLYLNERERKEAREFLQQEGFYGEKLVGISPGAKWEKKRWPLKRFSQVGENLAKREKTKVILFGNEEEQPLTRKMAKLMKTESINAAGRTDLRLLMALLERCDLLITNDSGPMHIATGVGTPVVAIFGPTHPKLGFTPLGEGDIVLSTNEPCSPCSLHGEGRCQRSKRFCMEGITVGDVLKAASDILSSNSTQL